MYFIIPLSTKRKNNTKNTVIYKRVLATESIELFNINRIFMKPVGMALKSPKTLMKQIKILNKFFDLHDTYRVYMAPGKPGKRPFFDPPLQNLEKHHEKVFFSGKVL